VSLEALLPLNQNTVATVRQWSKTLEATDILLIFLLTSLFRVVSNARHSGSPEARSVIARGEAVSPLDVVKLTPLMSRTAGRPEIVVGLIDGPVLLTHPDLVGDHIREVSGPQGAACSRASSVACTHGTFVAGMLSAKRGAEAPAICPDCTLVVRSIFSETGSTNGRMPSATPEELADAILDTVNAGARVINLSAALAQPSVKNEQRLRHALDYAAHRGVVTVAAAGNQGTVGSSVITRHPWVIPVSACDLQGRPMADSNLGSSIGKGGLGAPGEGITSLGPGGKSQTFGGTSAAAPFVTGAIALLWSEFPAANAARVRVAITQAGGVRRNSVVPPLLDAFVAYQSMGGVQ
jgi:subtilisin family serine protease